MLSWVWFLKIDPFPIPMMKQNQKISGLSAQKTNHSALKCAIMPHKKILLIFFCIFVLF